MVDQPDDDHYEYDEPIPEPLGVELHQTNQLGEKIDEFGEGIDPGKELKIESEFHLRQYLSSLQGILQMNDLITEDQYEILDIEHQMAFTSPYVDGYDDHKMIEKWDSHEDIDDRKEYRDYLIALARRIEEAYDGSDGAPHNATMDISGVANKVWNEMPLDEAKAEMRRIDPPENIQEP